LVLPTILSFGQTGKYNYKDKKEPNSKIIARGYNFTIEKLKNKKYVFKKYFPETRVITHFVTFKSKKFQIKDGLYIERYDDGEVILKGTYINNKREGFWKEHSSEGNYKNGKKIGQWLSHDSKDIKIQESNYVEGELHGKQITYDSLGQIKMEVLYESGLLVSTEVDTMSKVIE
jgi:hypothetical protein